MPIVEGYIVGVASSLTVAVLQHWHGKQSSPSEEKVLRQVYQSGFEAMSWHAGQGVKRAGLITLWDSRGHIPVLYQVLDQGKMATHIQQGESHGPSSRTELATD